MTADEYRAMRQEMGLTQAKLALFVRVSRETIAKREAGHPRYPITTEAALAISFLFRNAMDDKKAKGS